VVEVLAEWGGLLQNIMKLEEILAKLNGRQRMVGEVLNDVWL